MVGPIIIIIALVVAIPVAVMISGGVLAGIIAYFLRVEADTNHEGSELIDLNS